jgi:peptide/nickel transport system substrate-binding protein
MRVAGALLVCALAAGVVGPASAGPVRYGGTLAVGMPSYPDSMDPTVSQTTGVTIFRDMCFRLYDTRFNHGDVEYVPQLAASMPKASKDGLSYTVQLRHGVLFNDDTPLNAQAVVTSYQRFITVPNSSRKTDFSSVADVTAEGRYTVVFHMNQRDSSFTSNVYVFSPTALVNEGASFAANPVCAGPFMFDHQDAGVDVTIVKSPYYWDKGNVYLDKIVFKPLADPAAAAAALEAGDVQVLTSVSPTQHEAIQSNSNLRVLRFPSQGFQSIVINIGNEAGVGSPYSTTGVGTALSTSPLLRRAFEEAIDRAALVRVVEQRQAVPTCTPIEPSDQPWFGLTKIPCTPYDPKDARRLVAKSGVTNPTVDLLDTAGGSTLDQFIQAEEAAVGIKVVIDPVDSSSTETAMLSAGKFDAAVNGYSGGPDPNGNTFAFLDTQGQRNYGGYSNPRMDYVLANGLKALQAKERAVNYRVAEQIVETDRPRIYLYAPTSYTAYSTNIGGLFLNGGGQLLFEFAQLK